MGGEEWPEGIRPAGRDGLGVRYAVPEDVPALRELERRAGEPFRTIGLDVVADDEPPAAVLLDAAAREGNILVVEDSSVQRDSRPTLVAWMWLSVVDGDLLVEQVSVDPGYRGRRLGSGLVLSAVERARERGFPGVVLTTFSDVPWNGPLYRRLGFRDMQDADIGQGLRAVRHAETVAGLDVLPRVCLRRPVGE